MRLYLAAPQPWGASGKIVMQTTGIAWMLMRSRESAVADQINRIAQKEKSPRHSGLIS
jgi:hypothetical protein